ncbi:type II toxin-antitoxin system Phd/YefM family antitoxin [Verrucomicrobiales bacterium]|nr:type II toxin-antitoxin system Phd/YefM family antitoxin [Verrucomicrobiales bacterium]
MSKVWQLQEAKAKFSQVVDSALTSGPQLVTKHGKPAVVVISEKEFRQIEENPPKKRRKTIIELMSECPSPGIFGVIEAERKDERDRATEENLFDDEG